MKYNHCFGSGLDPDLFRSVDLYSESGSGSRRAKMTHKNRKTLRNFLFWSVWCSLLRAECFCFSFAVLGIFELSVQFLMKKFVIFFPAVIFLKFLGHLKPWIRVGTGSVLRLKCWILIRIKWIRIRKHWVLSTLLLFLSCLGWGEGCGGRAGQLPPAPPVPGAEAGRPQCGHRARHSLVLAFTCLVLLPFFWAFFTEFLIGFQTRFSNLSSILPRCGPKDGISERHSCYSWIDSSFLFYRIFCKDF